MENHVSTKNMSVKTAESATIIHVSCYFAALPVKLSFLSYFNFAVSKVLNFVDE